MNLFFALAIISATCALIAYGASLGNNNLLELHLSCPLAIIPCMVSLLLLTIGIVVMNSAITLPITIVYFVVGYLFSLKWFGIFINSREESVKETILEYNISKYFFPILMIYFWPFIIIFLQFSKIFKYIEIKTPGKIFDEIKKKG